MKGQRKEDNELSGVAVGKEKKGKVDCELVECQTGIWLMVEVVKDSGTQIKKYYNKSIIITILIK